MRASCILICLDCEMVTHYPSNEQVRQDIVLICCLVLSVETDIPSTTNIHVRFAKVKCLL